MKIGDILVLILALGALSTTPSHSLFGRDLYNPSGKHLRSYRANDGDPYVTIGVHRVGRLGITVINTGNIGTSWASIPDPRDPSRIAPSGVYPYPGNNKYLFTGTFWIGAVVGRDTLVSVGSDGWFLVNEMWPDPYPEGDVIYRSILNADDVDAVSEEDFIMKYTDTVTNPALVAPDPVDSRPHLPLNIEVNQHSYAWSYSYAEDFVLFDMSIKNIGHRFLNQVYMSLYVDADVGRVNSTTEFRDDISGFRRDIDSPFGCGWIDTINIAWIADNNGRDDTDSEDDCPFDPGDYTGINGMRVIRTPSDSLKYSFNWWISNGNARLDFGPRRAGTPDDPFRDFGGFLGTPVGDRNKYYIMRHEEFDYDQLFSAKDFTSEGWLERGPEADDFADGYDTRFLLSFGPFDIAPGEVLPLTFAYVAGEDFHVNCEAYDEIFNRYAPEEYYNTLNFADIGLNAIWAGQIYDNPGVDTDGDGYRGKYRVCVESTLVDGIYEISHDTIYYEGDGVPDFKGASPPPPPELWVISPYPVGDTLRSLVVPHVTEQNTGEITVQWYGYRSETTHDPFSGIADFEGYRVWISLTDNLSDFYKICSYDKEDYNRYIFNPYATTPENEWVLSDLPFNIEELRDLYGSGFSPYMYDRDNPFYWEGSSYYFDAQDWNQSKLIDTNMIHKVYPDQPFPTILNHDSAHTYYPEELTDDGYFKYFMYEYNIRNLLPSQKYFVSATAFDFGSPSSGLASLETRPNKNFITELPQNQSSMIESRGLNVIVYPNPYRIDADYQDNGFEGRGLDDLADDRKHRLHFTNLPYKCTIRIFSIDGDLIREIHHDLPEDWPESMHEEWDLITRNTQAAVAGIYYYSVESAYGNQVGKFVLIK